MQKSKFVAMSVMTKERGTEKDEKGMV